VGGFFCRLLETLGFVFVPVRLIRNAMYLLDCLQYLSAKFRILALQMQQTLDLPVLSLRNGRVVLFFQQSRAFFRFDHNILSGWPLLEHFEDNEPQFLHQLILRADRFLAAAQKKLLKIGNVPSQFIRQPSADLLQRWAVEFIGGRVQTVAADQICSNQILNHVQGCLIELSGGS
jgi:hypothetical protein